jgi:hypothetical protein
VQKTSWLVIQVAHLCYEVSEVGICNFNPHFRNIAGIGIDCRKTDLKSCRYAAVDLQNWTSATLIRIQIWLCRDAKLFTQAELDLDLKVK